MFGANWWHKKESPLFTGNHFGFGVNKDSTDDGSPTFFSGSGGEVTDGVTPGNGYKYHYWKTPGTFSVGGNYSATTKQVDVLVVASGGQGGNRAGGGGGAGGVALASGTTWIPVTTAGTDINITVGAAPPPNSSPQPEGNKQPGNASLFGPGAPTYQVEAAGGGAGGADSSADSGGSGGGKMYDEGSAGSGTQPTKNPSMPWVTNYGHNGSKGYNAPNWNSGAGGGASGNAADGSSSARGSAGNSQNFPDFDVPLYMPAPDPYRPGINPLPGYHYGGGGGAGAYGPPFSPQNHSTSANNGGGGTGAPSIGDGTPGVNGLGGGGGGAGGGTPGAGPAGGHGGAGIVVLRYQV